MSTLAANASVRRASPPQAAAPATFQAWSVLTVSTLAFTVCFMVWMMFGVIGIPIRKQLGLSATEFGLLTAMPVLTGSLIRVPLGIWTDRFGGRIVMTILMALTVPAIWLMGYATQYWHFLAIGLFVGLAGGSFSVGTPYVARWFPKSRQGFRDGRLRRRQLGRRGQQVHRPGPARGLRLDHGAPGVCGGDAGHGAAVLDVQLQQPCPPGSQHRDLHRPAQGTEGSEGAALLPVLQHRLRRVRGPLAVDGAVLRRRIRPGHPRGRPARSLLLAARRRPARHRRRDVGQVWGAQRHLVGDVGELDLPVPAVLSADGFHHPHRQRPQDLPCGTERLHLHRPDVHPGHRLGLRQGQRIQVHQRRLPQEHRRHLRHRGPGRRPGRLRPAHPVWRVDGSHRHPFQRLHADVRRRLGVPRSGCTSPRYAAPKSWARMPRPSPPLPTKETSCRPHSSNTGTPKTLLSGGSKATPSPAATSGSPFLPSPWPSRSGWSGRWWW